jgi:hypothetical protein
MHPPVKEKVSMPAPTPPAPVAEPLLHPAIDATLTAARNVHGMELAFLGRLTDSTFSFARVQLAPEATWDVPGDGFSLARTDSMCHRMIASSRLSTSDAGLDAIFGDSPVVSRFGITSYVGVPVTLTDGSLWGSLCGLDRREVDVSDAAVDTMATLAAVMATHLTPLGHALDLTVRRFGGTWRVADTDVGDLLSAMVLSDVIAAELDELALSGRPERGEEPRDEAERLRVTVAQLERALSARVVIEQAIGVMSERRRITPRQAFEQLRGVARGSGRKVHDLAQEVVRSATSQQALPTALRRATPTATGAPSPVAVARAIRH